MLSSLQKKIFRYFYNALGPRDCFELGIASIPPVNYHMPLENGEKSEELSWYVSLMCYKGLQVDGKPCV